MSSLPNCQAAGLVDLDTGEILAMSQQSSIDPDTAVMIGASIHDRFNHSRIEQLESLPESSTSPVDELVYLCQGLSFVFLRATPRSVLFIIGSEGANFGLLSLRGHQTVTALGLRADGGQS
ncbi:MAG: hypothetical protein AAF604_16040 [Acidobacteriota bacterium]